VYPVKELRLGADNFHERVHLFFTSLRYLVNTFTVCD
jgi:hypothetical protein